MTALATRHRPTTAVVARPGGADRRVTWSALWAAAGLVGVFLIFVRTESGQLVDDAAMRGIATVVAEHDWAQLVLDSVSALSVAAFATTLTIITALARGNRRAVAVALTGAGTLLVAEVLKVVLVRPALLGEAGSNSFPSGHVAAVAGLAAAVLLAVPSAVRWALAVTVLAPAVAMTGLATVVLEWHRPSDVLGSILVAATVGGLGLLAERLGALDRPARESSR